MRREKTDPIDVAAIGDLLRGGRGYERELEKACGERLQRLARLGL